MNTQETLVAVFVGVFALLAVASGIGALLALGPGRSGASPGVRNLNARIRAWWFILAALAVAFWAGPLGLCLLFAAVSAQALREFAAVAAPEDARLLALAGGFALPVQYALVAGGRLDLFALAIPVAAFVALPVACLAAGGPRYGERCALLLWALMLCVFGLSHVAALAQLEFNGLPGGGLLLAAFLLLTVQSSDVLQYVWGRLLGRRPVSPRVSPAKTLEGLAGGVLCSTALGAALWWMTPFNPWQAALLALTVNALGFLGGLVLSAIKRERGVKDWGRLIDGHGGMLDRVDSLCLSAPVFFHLVRLGWAS